jgi:O-antigen/teichoic acid export membrane protein
MMLVGLSMVTGILTARLLGPSGRGEFAIIILWPSILSALGSLGIKESLTYFQAGRLIKSARLVGYAFVFATLQAILLMGIGYTILPLLVHAKGLELLHQARVYLVFIPLNLLALYAIGILQGKLDIYSFNLVRSSVNIVHVILLCILWMLDLVTVWRVVMSLLIANAVTVSLAAFFILKNFGIEWKFDYYEIKKIFTYGIQNHIGTLSSLLNQRADQAIISILLPAEQLGWYSAAANISGVTRSASGAFSTLLFPRIAGADANDQKTILASYSRFNSTVTILICLGLMVAIPFLVPLLYGQAYLPSIWPAEILTVATVFVGVGQAWSSSFRGGGAPKVPAMAEMISLLITCAGMIVLLPYLGIIGAAITSFLAYFVSAYYLGTKIRVKWGISFADLIKPIPVSQLIQSLVKLY